LSGDTYSPAVSLAMSTKTTAPTNTGNSSGNSSGGNNSSASGAAGGTPPNGSGKYSNLKEPKKVGEGLETTSAQRKRILEENKRQNGGVLKSDESGKELSMPKKAEKGVKADMNQAEVDHIKAKSKGGSNSNSNLRVISKEENIKKSNN
jgi:hypothetical protein